MPFNLIVLKHILQKLFCFLKSIYFQCLKLISFIVFDCWAKTSWQNKLHSLTYIQFYTLEFK